VIFASAATAAAGAEPQRFDEAVGGARGQHACGEDIAVHELDLHGRRGEREARTIDDQRAADAEVVDHEGPPVLAHGEVARAHLD